MSWTLDGFLLVAADGCRIKATDIVGFGVAGVVEPMTEKLSLSFLSRGLRRSIFSVQARMVS